MRECTVMVTCDAADDFSTRTAARLARGGWHDVTTRSGTGFDQAEVTAHRGPLRVRVVRDRGRVGVDLQPDHDPAEWFDLEVVLAAIEVPDGDPEGTEDDRLGAHVEVITAAFHPDRWPRTRERMKVLERDRLRRQFPDLRRVGGEPV